MSSGPSLRPTTALLPEAVERYFEVALYLLVLMGFGTLASTGGLDLPTVAFVTAAFLARGYCLVTRRAVIIPDRWTTTLTIAYVAFYLADYFVISGSFLSSTVHLVLFVLVVRLFSARRDRDFYFLAVIAFLMVLAAAVLTVDTTFLLAFVGFMLVAVVTVILMEMRRASANATVRSAPTTNVSALREMGVSLATLAPVMVVLISVGGAAIFFVLPRVSSGYLSAYTPTSAIATGFSDRVQLGRIGEIQQSSALVMHIRINDDPHGAFDLKWRGVTLSVFDGATWSNPHEQHVLPRSADGRFLLSQAQASRGPRTGQVIHYRVLMEPFGSNVFFLAPAPLTLEGNYRFLTVDGSGAVLDPDPGHPVSNYEATSDISRPSALQLRAASDSYPPGILLEYLQLPKLDPRITAMTEEITSSQANNYDKAIALETYLRTKFGYTLQLPRTRHRDPLAYFLFERKQGHCEYFASAMAVMLRTLRIPSRVVNGFRTGEFNDVTSQYLVRASNAHSWVEAYFPGYGWVSFDPTPAAPMEVRTGWNRMLLYMDALASFWREWVVNYDTSHQAILGREATRNGLDWARTIRDWARREYSVLLAAARSTQRRVTDAPERWTVAGVLGTMLLVMAANTQRLWRAFRRHRVATHPERSPTAAATIWYERALRMLASRGFPKSPAQTPAEFAKSVQDESVRASLLRLTEHYECARFGESREDAARLPELYEEVSAATRR